MNQNTVLLAQSAQTTAIMYVGPKAIKRDTVSGFTPQMSFPRNEPVETPILVAQALLPFDCFLPATEESIEAAKAAEDFAAEQAAEQERLAAEALQEELDMQNTTIEVDGEGIDIAKLTFGEIEALCAGQELDVTREDGEAKEVLAVRVRKAYEAANQAE